MCKIYGELFAKLKIDGIIIYFQPIFSFFNQTVFGVEALARGVKNEKIISPLELFKRAEENNVILELDRCCRDKALQAFAHQILPKYPNMFLFVNLNPQIITERKDFGQATDFFVQELGLKSNQIVLEICEDRTDNQKLLLQYVQHYQKNNYLIALDDVGNAYSNFNRLLLLTPHIYKIDRELVKDVSKSWIKNKMVSSLCYLSREIGALVVAEGVETQEDALELLEFGIDLLQGYYFARPLSFDKLDLSEGIQKLRAISKKFKICMQQKLLRRKKFILKIKKITKNILLELEKFSIQDWEQILKDKICLYQGKIVLDCLYVLDTNGIQLTETICNGKKNPKAAILNPAHKGTNLSCRPYFYTLYISEVNYYVSNPYISMATGRKCITVSKLFFKNNCQYVLCVDVDLENSAELHPDA